MTLMMSGDKGISAFPDGDKLLSWVATVEGPADSVYEGLKYKLRLDFKAGYPYTAPTVRFTTACFHPNVDQHGNICLDILKEKWSALYEVRTILLSIQSLLGELLSHKDRWRTLLQTTADLAEILPLALQSMSNSNPTIG